MKVIVIYHNPVYLHLYLLSNLCNLQWLTNFQQWTSLTTNIAAKVSILFANFKFTKSPLLMATSTVSLLSTIVESSSYETDLLSVSYVPFPPELPVELLVLKDEGNGQFVMGQYKGVLKKYTQAVKPLEGTSYVFTANSQLSW